MLTAAIESATEKGRHTSPSLVAEISTLFFSRGRGRGHAIPDLEIVRELAQITDAITVQFVSYATGAATFRAEGQPVIDLGLPEENSFVETIRLASRTIERFRPQVVISHEEFGAVVAAKLAGIPSIFVCTWLPPVDSIAAEAVALADSVLIIERPGLFPVLPGLADRLTHVGPILRKMKYSLEDRAQVRGELGIEPDALTILVVPGGAWPEAVAPIWDTVLGAFLAAQRPAKRLIWLAGQDFKLLQERSAGVLGIDVIEYCTPVERLIVAADVVITKGTHGISLDAASVGVPSISLSTGQNPIDEVLVPRIHNNVALMANAVSSSILLEYIEAVTDGATPRPPLRAGLYDKPGATLAAEHIAEAIRRLTT